MGSPNPLCHLCLFLIQTAWPNADSPTAYMMAVLSPSIEDTDKVVTL